MSRSLPLLAAAVAVAACDSPPSAPPAHPFAVEFTATTGDGLPVPGAAVSLADQPAGSTDHAGQLSISITAADGTTLPLSATCPDGYRAAAAPESLTLRRLRRLGAGAHPTRLVVTIECAPALRIAAVIVRAPGGAGLPVVVDGEPVALTDNSGIAHLGLERPPHTTVRIHLDTASQPRLRPQHPQLAVTVADADDVYVLDQPFERIRKRRPPPKRSNTDTLVPPPPEPRRPIRIR